MIAKHHWLIGACLSALGSVPAEAQTPAQTPSTAPAADQRQAPAEGRPGQAPSGQAPGGQALSGQAEPETSANTAQAEAGIVPDRAAGDDIVVTASRRSESIREVPTAVSAFSGAKLRETQVVSLSDLAALTPNVQISSYATSANINIRGIGNGNFNYAGGEPGVAVHQDGVYLGQASLALNTFLDVQRVEILRGPQGTLFGRNATGGAINIIPNIPTKDPTFGAELTVGADPALVRSTGFVSGPLDAGGKLLARVSAEQNYVRGYSRNRAPDGPSRLDTNDDFAVRGQLLWTPTDRMQVRLLAEHAREKSAGPAAYLLGTPSGAPAVFPFPLLPLFGLPPVAPITPPAGLVGDPGRRIAYANLGSRDLRATTINLVADWSVGGGALKATGSYNESRNRIDQDGDGTGVAYTSTRFGNRAHQEYAELIYTSDPARPFTWVLGGNYYHEDLDQTSAVPTLNAPLPFEAGGSVDTRSWAAFGHVQYAVTPALKAFGGVRYSHDRKRVTTYNTYIPPFAGSDRDTWAKVTYDVGVLYDFSRSLTGYVKYATGYKSGGFSVGSFNPAFDPETNDSYEAGLKGSFLGGALQANIAAFHMKYDDLQVNQVVGLATQVTNAAKATIDGAELEAIVRPTSQLRLEASGSWLHARFDSFSTQDSARPLLGTLQLGGNRLPGAPRFTASLGVFDDVPLASGTLTPGARFNWKSRLYLNEFNVPVASQEARGKLDLFLDYRSSDKRWSVGLFVLNVTDETIKSNVLTVSALLGSLAVGQYQPGRQAGATVRVHF